jgi:hypothetical protein
MANKTQTTLFPSSKESGCRADSLQQQRVTIKIPEPTQKESGFRADSQQQKDSTQQQKLDQAKEDVRDLLIDIQDDPETEKKLSTKLEKYKEYTTGELAEAVPNLEKTITVQQEGLTVMSTVVIK